MHIVKLLFLSFFFYLLAFYQTKAVEQPPTIVTSIPPLYWLAKDIIKEHGKLDVLIHQGQNPHHANLKPSQVKTLLSSDVIFYIDNHHYETFLTPYLKKRSKHSENIHLIKTLNLASKHDDDHDHDKHAIDPHLWLSPKHTIAIINIIETKLSAYAPAYANHYRKNASLLIDRIKKLNHKLKETLFPLKNQGILVYHDAYTYLAESYNLNIVGTLLPSNHHHTSIKHVNNIQKLIDLGKVQCILTEPNANKLLLSQFENLPNIRYGTLDPLGATIPDGIPFPYGTLMTRLSNNLQVCLP